MSIINEFKEKAENPNRTEDKGFVNDNTNSSILIKKNGDINIAASNTVQYKLKYDTGQRTEVSMQSNTITNRKNIVADDIVLNKHKLNPYLYELTDMKEYNNIPTLAIGNLTMMATVLVKCWEPNLQKWVLIRRPMRTPIFSNLLNVPDSPEGMNVDTNISEELENCRTSSEGMESLF